MITGITLIRNGVTLGYPFEQAISSLAELCSQVIVNVDPGSDTTLQAVRGLRKKYPHIQILDSVWNMKNTGDGSELAHQANKILDQCDIKNEWITYMQADEMIHQKDHFQLKEFICELPDNYSQIELYRTYFYQDLRVRLLQDEIWLGRIFRRGTHRVGGDGMWLDRQFGEVIRSAFWIYHYSRMGREEKVNSRLRNLDSLFHEKEVVDSFTPFTYAEAGKGKELASYKGSHPEGIQEFYRDV